MAYVNFNRTKPASFALSEYAGKNTIYFTTDTSEIIVNGKSFGGAVDLTELYKLIEALAEEIDALTTELSNLEGTHVEEAEVIAAALNDLNKRLIEGISDLTSLIEQNTTYISTIKSIVDNNYLTTLTTLNDLTTLVNLNSENITSLESVIVENELTTSSALNDLNSRLLDVISTQTIDALFL